MIVVGALPRKGSGVKDALRTESRESPARKTAHLKDIGHGRSRDPLMLAGNAADCVTQDSSIKNQEVCL